jgi:hypothetical protein
MTFKVIQPFNAETQRRSADTAATKRKLLAENSSGRMMLNYGFHG